MIYFKISRIDGNTGLIFLSMDVKYSSFKSLHRKYSVTRSEFSLYE